MAFAQRPGTRLSGRSGNPGQSRYRDGTDAAAGGANAAGGAGRRCAAGGGGRASGGRGTGSDITRAGRCLGTACRRQQGRPATDQQVAGFAATWEIDLFGGIRRAIEAGRYDVEAAAAARNAVLDQRRGGRGAQLRRAARIADAAGHLAGQYRWHCQQLRDFEQARFDRGIDQRTGSAVGRFARLDRLQSELPTLQRDIQARRTIWRCCWASIPRIWQRNCRSRG